MHSISSKRKEDDRCQPAGLIAERKTVFIGDCSTACLRMVNDVSPLVKYLENLREFAIAFGFHQKKQTCVSFTLDRAINKIQEVYDFDCQCVNQLKPFLGTTTQTQGPKVLFLRLS